MFDVRKRFIFLFFVFTAVVCQFFVGCDSRVGADAKNISSSSNTQNQINLLTSPSDMTIVNVGDSAIKIGDFKKRLDLEVACYTHNNKAKLGQKFDQKLHDFIMVRVPSIVPELTNQKLIDFYMATNNVALPQDKAKKVFDDAKKAFNHKGDLKKFAEERNIDGEYFLSQLLAPAKMDFACIHFTKDPLTASVDEIYAGLQRLKKYYERATATNAVTYATASNVLKKIVAENLDFKDAGFDYGQVDKEDAETWETLTYPEFENKELRDWAFSAKPGSIGGPFDLEDGLSIVKLLSKKDGALVESMAAEEIAEVTLARITFLMVDPEPEPRTREHVKSVFEAHKKEKAMKKFIDTLYAETKIYYPHGTNLVYKGDYK